MKLSSQIKPISYLKAHAAEIVRHLGEQREPLVITQNGEAKVVMQDIESYEQTQETMALLKILALGAQAWMTGTDLSLFDALTGRAEDLGGLRPTLQQVEDPSLPEHLDRFLLLHALEVQGSLDRGQRSPEVAEHGTQYPLHKVESRLLGVEGDALVDYAVHLVEVAGVDVLLVGRQVAILGGGGPGPGRTRALPTGAGYLPSSAQRRHA